MIVSVLSSVVVEEKYRKLRNVVFKREKHKDESGVISLEPSTKFCSCDVKWMDNRVVNSTYWHVKAMVENIDFRNRIQSVTDCGFLDYNRTYYGELIVVREGAAQRVVTVEGNGGRERNLDAR